jgi:nucleoside-diphosphate-sugar epimerase
MKVLITGGAGYLGGSVVDKLLQTEHEFIVYDNLLYEEIYQKKVPFVFGDVRDINKLKPYLKWADVAIWLCALVGDGACELDRPLAKEINADSLQFLKDNFKGKIIFTSSASVYGASDELLNETSKLNPLSHYALTKIWAEEILKGTNSLIFRLGTLFGTSDEFARIRSDLILNTLIMFAHAKNKISVFGGKQYRPLINVKDVAKIICQSLNSNKTGIYNIHYQNNTVLELANLLKKYYHNLKIEITETKFEDNRNYRIISEKAKQELNFNPTITLDEGIIELKKLLDENRIKNPFLDRYSNYLYLKQLGEKND